MRFGNQDLSRSKGVLVEEGAEGKIKFGKLTSEGVRTFKEGFDADSPEFLVVGGGVGIEEVGFAGLHTFEYGAGDKRKIVKMMVKSIIAAVLDGEVDISEGMGHFVQANILAI